MTAVGVVDVTTDGIGGRGAGLGPGDPVTDGFSIPIELDQRLGITKSYVTLPQAVIHDVFSQPDSNSGKWRNAHRPRVFSFVQRDTLSVVLRVRSEKDIYRPQFFCGSIVHPPPTTIQNSNCEPQFEETDLCD